MSINSKQKTLFESWSTSNNLSKNQSSFLSHQTKCSLKSNQNAKYNFQQAVDDVEDVDDVDLLSATVAFEHSKADLSFQSVDTDSDLCGFDKFSGDIWVYPTNYPVREYQYAIVKNALFQNTLVALPTGLGKTFIAAVVLYNFYRWYPQGKVVFMAPTKPLVSQQIEACYKIMGIPMEDQAQLTGATMASNRRSDLWSSKRVFFVTPQVINNDLAKGVCPASSIKCLVVDEAHKALGNYAYCQVVQQLLCHNRNFRVLALSATPGSDLKTVQQVINNLLISKIEIRAEDSIDIKQYVHTRSIDKVVVKLTEEILSLREKYFNVIQMFISCLVTNKALYNKDVKYLTKYALLMARDQFRKDPPSGLPRSVIGTLEGAFAISISLYHGLELLLQHGMKSFFIFLKGIMDGPRSNVRSKTMLYGSEDFRSLYDQLTTFYGANPDSVVLCTQAGGTQLASKVPTTTQRDPESCIYSHPKMKKLEEVVLNHFRSSEGSNDRDHNTRVMIFCQYRDIVREITELLQRHRPLVRPMQFVGHAPSTNNDGEKSSGKSNRRFTQKDQLMVVSKFRTGDYNILVSTCVGEEGLDIGDVDLIVCYDSHKSPIRLVQRMGRTGRKRKGKIVMLVTEGKEERDYNSSLASRKTIHKAILGAGKTLQYYPHNPRMIPEGFKPKCHRMFISVPEKKVPDKSTKNWKRTKAPPRADITNMLNTMSCGLNADQKEVWKKNLMLSSKERNQLKTLPPRISTGKCIHLEKKPRKFVDKKIYSKYLSLTEWLPWQSRLQFSKFIGHSSKSKTLTELLQFCDDVRENGATQCGYKDVKSFNLTNGSALESKSNRDFFNKNKENKRAASKIQRKPLIVISDDDDDCFQSDDFSVFDSKRRLPAEQDDIASVQGINEADGGVENKANSSSSIHLVNANVGSPHSTAVSDDPAKSNFEKSKDRSSFFFPNLSALSPSSTNSSESDCDWTTSKTSKNEFDICISRTRISSSVSAISLDFLRDDVAGSYTTQGKTPTCFKVWESDDDDHQDAESDQSSGHQSRNSDLEDLVNSESTVSCSKSKISLANTLLHNSIKPHTELACKEPVPVSIAPCSPLAEKSHCNVPSFDGSADMFAPQFELDFDLDFDDFTAVPESEPPPTSVAKLFQHTASQNRNNLESDIVTVKAEKENPALEKPRSCSDSRTAIKRQTLSPATRSSFDARQSKRIENRKLFAELNSFECDSPPCAKVKPQTPPFVTENSCVVIDDSPLQSRDLKPCSSKSLKRPKQSRGQVKIDDWSDDDDIFQFINSPIKKKKKEIIEKKVFDSSPTLQKNMTSCNVDDDDNDDNDDDDDINSEVDCEPNVEVPFRRSGGSSEKNTSLLLVSDQSNLAEKSPSMKMSSCHSLVKRSFKQSTPKPDSLSPYSQSDESFVVRRKNPAKDKKKLKFGHVVRRNMFICDEAEVTSDGAAMSSDDDNDDDVDDQDLLDFVNDASQLTQLATQSEVPDERALYLRSLNNMSSTGRADTATLGGKFKLAYGRGEDVDVFSQVPDRDISDYVNDSFCVDSNEVSDVTDLGDVTLLESQCFSPGDVGPKTRAQKQFEHFNFHDVNKPRKRIAVFDEDNDSDATQLSDPRPGTSSNSHPAKQSYGDRSSIALGDSSVRHCELCDAVLVTKGWLCRDCVVIMKRSEVEQQRPCDVTELVNKQKEKVNRGENEVRKSGRHSLLLSRQERLKRSKEKQKELRAKLKIKRNSLDSNESKTSSPNVSPGNSLQTSMPSKRKVPSKLYSDDISNASFVCSSNVSETTSSSKSTDKLTILIDNKEVSSGATQITQLLRTTYEDQVHVVSLQCCSYVVSSRCAVWRKTVDDVSNAMKRQKLALLVKQARNYYRKFFVIVEKKKVKKGWVNVKPVQASNFTAAYLELTQAGINVLHSDSQEGSAKLLHTLAVREVTSGYVIPAGVSCHATNQQLQPLFNIYLSIPGIAFVHALFLCHHFKSLKEALKSSVENLVSDVKLPLNAAENVFIFLRKKFDIQMTPL